MVENILTTDIDKDVDDPHHHHHHHSHHHHSHLHQPHSAHNRHHSCESMTSSSSDTESDVMSDIKESVCGSPTLRSTHHGLEHMAMMQTANSPGSGNNGVGGGGGGVADKDKLHLSESLLRTYAMIRQGGGQLAGAGLAEEMCCTKCGHFQPSTRAVHQQHKRTGKTNDGDFGDIDAADTAIGDAVGMKCIKCGGSCETVGPVKDATTILSEAERTTTSIGGGVTKPILKFSVSAILGDRKECVKVRNGKCCEEDELRC